LETYKEIYQKEIERRAGLNNDLSIPIALISFLSTGAFFYLSNYNFSDNKALAVIFISLISCGGGFLLFSIVYLLQSYLLLTKKGTYDYLAFPNEIDDYFKKVKDYYIGLGQKEADAIQNSIIALEEYFLAAYIRTSSKNMSINDRRAADLFRCKRQILYSAIALIIAFVPYLYNFYTKQEKIPKVQIVNNAPVQ